jgi:CheY-like chemotaxis protein
MTIGPLVSARLGLNVVFLKSRSSRARRPAALLPFHGHAPAGASASPVVSDPLRELPARIGILRVGHLESRSSQKAPPRNEMFQPRGTDMTRLLVVDDDPMVCMAIEIYLERQGFDVTVADGGEAGLRAIDGSTFDLMIVDIFMPHMRGFESIRIFHERAPTIPLIAMSGYAFANLDTPAPDFLRMALELGATRCLRKPFTPVALLTVINECLADVRSGCASVVR